MDKFQDRQNSMEDRLYRLVPATMSHAAQQRLEETIDDLAGVDTSAVVDEVSSFQVQKIWAVAAVVAVSLVTVFTFSNKGEEAITYIDSEENSSLVLINSSNVVDGRADDGLVFSNDGSLAQYRYRYSISNEQQLLDTDSGLVITIREPSYEVVTVPKQLF